MKNVTVFNRIIEPIAPFSVFVGENGSGKSSVLASAYVKEAAASMFAPTLYRLEYSELVKPTGFMARMASSGLGLARRLRELRETGLPGRMCDLTGVLPRAVLDESGRTELRFDTPHAKNVSAGQVGTGILMTLGMLTAVADADAHHLVLIDDIERHLHPLLQRKLIPVLRELADERAQVMVTTHSPYIVDGFTAEEVWMLNRADDEGMGAVRLADLPGAEGALKVVTTGELWSVRGERDAHE